MKFGRSADKAKGGITALVCYDCICLHVSHYFFVNSTPKQAPQRLLGASAAEAMVCDGSAVRGIPGKQWSLPTTGHSKRKKKDLNQLSKNKQKQLALVDPISNLRYFMLASSGFLLVVPSSKHHKTSPRTVMAPPRSENTIPLRLGHGHLCGDSWVIGTIVGTVCTLL